MDDPGIHSIYGDEKYAFCNSIHGVENFNKSSKGGHTDGITQSIQARTTMDKEKCIPKCDSECPREKMDIQAQGAECASLNHARHGELHDLQTERSGGDKVRSAQHETKNVLGNQEQTHESSSPCDPHGYFGSRNARESPSVPGATTTSQTIIGGFLVESESVNPSKARQRQRNATKFFQECTM
ncbi:hypothetical protein MHU86_7965 [Fragilaria crotonensis]|nr:hypothetical protein MHU86_7965 [Fragilaria crotonensis]